METLTHAICMAREWQAAQIPDATAQKKIPTQIKRRHDADSHYCFTDAAWTENSKTAGLGWN